MANLALTNNKGAFSISINPPEPNTQVLLTISAPGYEPITINPRKGNGDFKENLGVIYLTSKVKGLEEEKIKISRITKEQINSLNADKKDLKYYAQERLNKQIDNLKFTIIPMVLNMLTQFGLSKTTELAQKSVAEIVDQLSSNTECPNETDLLEIIKKKNSLVKQLNTILNVINSTTTVLGINSITITATKTVLTTAESIPSIYNPTPPGVIKKLDKTLNILNATNSALSSILNLLSQTLKQVIDLLNLLDISIGKCAQSSNTTMEAIPQELINLTQQQSQQQSPVVTNINGFEMEVETEPTLNELKRKRAIAKNKQGIIMLKGEWSYSSIDQILIDELVFYIQQNNLKAD
jgi:hypothetical protein